MKKIILASLLSVIAALFASLYLGGGEVPVVSPPDVAVRAATSSVEEVGRPLVGQAAASLVVAGRVYPLSVPEGTSVYEAMEVLASTTDFRFESQEYSGLGYFIRGIGGTRNSDGRYWTFYVNGSYSMVGASQYRLREGDSVEWKFEKK